MIKENSGEIHYEQKDRHLFERVAKILKKHDLELTDLIELVLKNTTFFFAYVRRATATEVNDYEEFEIDLPDIFDRFVRVKISKIKQAEATNLPLQSDFVEDPDPLDLESLEDGIRVGTYWQTVPKEIKLSDLFILKADLEKFFKNSTALTTKKNKIHSFTTNSDWTRIVFEPAISVVPLGQLSEIKLSKIQGQIIRALYEASPATLKTHEIQDKIDLDVQLKMSNFFKSDRRPEHLELLIFCEKEKNGRRGEYRICNHFRGRKHIKE